MVVECRHEPRILPSAVMSPAAKASVAFGLYAGAMGVLLALVPNPVVTLFGMPPTEEPWVRVTAAMALALSVYYITAGQHELVAFFKASIAGRFAFAVVVTGCAIAWQWWPLLIFAGVDASTACLTAYLLRAQK